jgi:hypothetical protein
MANQVTICWQLLSFTNRGSKCTQEYEKYALYDASDDSAV